MSYVYIRVIRGRKLECKTAEVLVRSGTGTLLGNPMRRYRVTVMLLSEIAGPDCPPVRVKVLGEALKSLQTPVYSL